MYIYLENFVSDADEVYGIMVCMNETVHPRLSRAVPGEDGGESYLSLRILTFTLLLLARC